MEEKGLDHKPGLEGTFKNISHEVEVKAKFKNFDTNNLKVTLLQVRRAAQKNWKTISKVPETEPIKFEQRK